MTRSNKTFAVTMIVALFGFAALATISAPVKASTETPSAAAQEFAQGVNGRVVNCREQANDTAACRVAEYTTKGTVITYQLACQLKPHGGFHCEEVSRETKKY